MVWEVYMRMDMRIRRNLAMEEYEIGYEGNLGMTMEDIEDGSQDGLVGQ